MELLRITRQIHCKVVEQRATLIHRQYNWDWGTSHSRPPIDPYLTSPLLQNSGGATVQTDNHTNTSSVITQFFTGRMLFLTPSQQHQSMSINNYTLNYPQMARMMPARCPTSKVSMPVGIWTTRLTNSSLDPHKFAPANRLAIATKRRCQRRACGVSRF